MPTVNFDNYLDKRLENSDFRLGFELENAKLEKEVAVMKSKEELNNKI